MVDYNNQSTISTPPGDVLKIAILERRHFVIGAMQQMKQKEFKGGHGELYVVKAGLAGLFWELEPALEADLTAEVFAKLKTDIESDIEEEQIAIDSFKKINAWLYGKNLTKFDTRKSIPVDDIEAVNLSHGF